eukprot:c15394_g1_i1 orf=72-488(+)
MPIMSSSRWVPSIAAAAAPPPSSSLSSSQRCRPCSASTEKENRRYLLASSLAGAFLVATSLDKSPPEYPPKSQLIEKLLEKSRANKAKYDQERLDSYYNRNFKEYFEFLEGTIRNKSELTENEKDILKWLDKTRSKKK